TNRTFAQTPSLHLRLFTKQPTRRAVGLRPTVLFAPCCMSLHEQGFDFLLVLACLQFDILEPPGKIGRGVEISVERVATDDTAKRLLIGTMGTIWIVTHAALLRGIGALDPGYGYPPFGCTPRDLPRDVRQAGSR